MIDHEHYRRALLADPRSEEPMILAHRAECDHCKDFATRLLTFEARLERAIKDDPKPTADVLPFDRPASRPTRRPRWLALAASILLGVLAAGGFWVAAPRSSLAGEVVNHTVHEPQAWNMREPVPAGVLDFVLKRANMSLDPHAPAVTYASACQFRGYLVPHLVVRSAQGPVTVMILVHETVAIPTNFDEHGYRGTIVPVPGHGSIAVLAHAPTSTAADLDALAKTVRNAIVWGPT